ncbi:MAG: hypothetical protein KatS3mg014_1823 [Actinomycetota bacterium]|nr:MAG: hypothetical protein KatS3mg014_1823 [Actinomycetota bacterium]
MKVHLRSGGAELYPWRGGGAYATVGSGSGVVRKDRSGGFTYRTADGDLYTFDAQGELVSARPRTSTARVSGQAAAYRYAFDPAGHLTSLTDPLGRQVTFTWSGSPARLVRVDVLGHVVRLAYGTDGPTRITTPAGETIELSYADTCNGRNLLSEIRDGEQAARGLPGWRIEHFYDTGPANTSWRVCRARKLFPPQPAGGTERWVLDYGSAGYKGFTSLTTLITDPRGVATSTAGDYTTVVDFNLSGLPIRIVAPKDEPATDPDEITTMVWDAEGNLLCTRAPQANALDQTQCSGADQRHGFNTEYAYDTTLRPFRLLSRTDPAPEAGAARLQRTYAYDSGPNFTGLWAELYENRTLSGIPADERRLTDLAQDWGTGHPAGISVDDGFSIRLSGYLVVPGNQARTYRFRVGSDDGVTLVVGDRVLLDCFGQDFSGTNCGQSEDPKAKLSPGLRPIVLEYQERSGQANLSLRWDQGTGDWQVIPEGSLVPNLGLLTSVRTGPDTGTNNLATETTYAYSGDEAKARGLVTARTRRDLDPDYAGPDEVRTTTFAYDDYGRRTEIVRFAGTAEEARTVRTFTDDPQTGSCLTRVEDPTGAVVEYACDAWGDVTEERVVIREVRAADGTVLQAAEVRTTTWTYDAVGRVTELDPAGPGLLRYGYDRAGRVVRQEELVEGTSTFAVTTYAYDDHATPPTMTETLPDPDRGGPLAAPVIVHTYDRVGNEISRTDPRNPSWTWQTDYDAQDRVVATRSPDGLRTTTAYSVLPYEVTVTDPAGIATVRDLDQLGRVVREQVGNLAPTTYTYDLRGNIKREEVSGAGTVYTWEAHTHNAFGNLVEDRAPYYDGTSVSPAVTTYRYDAAGRLAEVQGPRPVNDKLTYAYDRAGRLVSATYFTSAAESFTASYTYNDAGEVLQEKIERGQGLTPFRRRTTYTKAGLPATVTVVVPGGDLTSTHTYTPAGWLKQTTDPRGCTVVRTYDDLGREIGTDAGACGGRLSFSYLPDGSLEQASDAGSGIAYSLAYDRGRAHDVGLPHARALHRLPGRDGLRLRRHRAASPPSPPRPAPRATPTTARGTPRAC